MAVRRVEIVRGDEIIIDGVSEIAKENGTRLFAKTARVLAGAQIMFLEEATSPGRQLYFALQLVQGGKPEERINGAAMYHHMMTELVNKPAYASMRDHLGSIRGYFAASQYISAMQMAKKVIAFEASALGGINWVPDMAARRKANLATLKT